MGGYGAGCTALDAHDTAALTRVIDALGRERGRIDVLVYNAVDPEDRGFIVVDPATKEASSYSLHKLRSNLELDLVAPMACVQAAFPYLTKGPTASTVLFSGGGPSIEPMAGAFSRGVGKAASKNMGFALAKELEPLNVHVCTVTLAGLIARGNSVNPDEAAEAYLAIHNQPAGAWDREWIYHGKDHIEKKPYPKDPKANIGPGYVNQPHSPGSTLRSWAGRAPDREEILRKVGAKL